MPAVGSAIAGVFAGLLGGALLVSWVAPLWMRLAGAGLMLALVAIPLRGRLVTAAAFLLTLGSVGLATLAFFAERPDAATTVAAAVSVAVGVGCVGVAITRRQRTGGGG
jgi:hypothetical protein